MIDLYIRCFV